MNPTAACWSVKGKQVVVGVQGGNLIQFTPAGEQRGEATGLPDQLLSTGDRWEGETAYYNDEYTRSYILSIYQQCSRLNGWKIPYS
jgi:hypothetical protein